jgi:hypothetical protein|tara:strand:- start:1051 stop:1431 length:381 start_codon:yes stop_codon:yes gene_type:complete
MKPQPLVVEIEFYTPDFDTDTKIMGMAARAMEDGEFGDCFPISFSTFRSNQKAEGIISIEDLGLNEETPKERPRRSMYRVCIGDKKPRDEKYQEDSGFDLSILDDEEFNRDFIPSIRRYVGQDSNN